MCLGWKLILIPYVMSHYICPEFLPVRIHGHDIHVLRAGLCIGHELHLVACRVAPAWHLHADVLQHSVIAGSNTRHHHAPVVAVHAQADGDGRCGGNNNISYNLYNAICTIVSADCNLTTLKLVIGVAMSGDKSIAIVIVFIWCVVEPMRLHLAAWLNWSMGATLVHWDYTWPWDYT